MGCVKNYEEQVYAGVLGKVIGAYMGGPGCEFAFRGVTHCLLLQSHLITHSR
jgi:hypothetical protein